MDSTTDDDDYAPPVPTFNDTLLQPNNSPVSDDEMNKVLELSRQTYEGEMFKRMKPSIPIIDEDEELRIALEYSKKEFEATQKIIIDEPPKTLKENVKTQSSEIKHYNKPSFEIIKSYQITMQRIRAYDTKLKEFDDMFLPKVSNYFSHSEINEIILTPIEKQLYDDVINFISMSKETRAFFNNVVK